MKNEEIIMLVFVTLIAVAVPFFAWQMRKERKEQEQAERNRWRK